MRNISCFKKLFIIITLFILLHVISYANARNYSSILLPTGDRVDYIFSSGNYYSYVTGREKLCSCRLAYPQQVTTPLGRFMVYSNIRFYENGKLNYCYLSELRTIDILGGTFNINYIEFRDDGDYSYCHLAGTQEAITSVGTLRIEGVYKIWFTDTIREYRLYLSEPQEIASPIGNLNVSNFIDFYGNGQINQFFLSHPQNITTPIGIFNANGAIRFYESGKIRQCNLSQPQDITTPIGIFKANGVIGFYESGKLRYFDLSNGTSITTSVGNLSVKEIALYENGHLWEAYLPYLQKITTTIGEIFICEGNKYLANRISFYSNGNLECCYISQASVIQTPLGSMSAQEGFLRFYESGKLKQCESSVPRPVTMPGGQTVATGPFRWYEDGTINFCRPNQDFYIYGNNYRGKIIGWAEDGSFLGEYINDDGHDGNDYVLKSN